MRSSTVTETAPNPNPVYASVAIARIPQFQERTVVEQAALKEALEVHARTVIAPLEAHERAVLDVDDGLALVLFGEPARALDVAQALQRSPEEAPLQVGLNFGPLALSSRAADAYVLGDGLNAASAASRFAAPRQLLVTQDFAHALDARDPARAEGLAPAGDFTDTRVRLHSLYTPDATKRKARWRRAAALGVGGVVAILLLGVVARYVGHLLFEPEPAVVTLAVKPRGEVSVDGMHQGRTPPLTRLELKPGRHVVIVRHAGYPPLELAVDLKPGERMTISHSFTAPRGEPKRDFWRDLKRRFGGA